MKDKETTRERKEETEREPHRIRLPGFLVDDEIALGDAIKKMTYAMGFKACSGCEKRATALNRWIHFSR